MHGLLIVAVLNVAPISLALRSNPKLSLLNALFIRIRSYPSSVRLAPLLISASSQLEGYSNI
jgi:hypothetical protein